MKVKAIIFGTTGMVGEGVLHECLQHPEVSSVLIINRRASNIKHEKITEIIHDNFFDFSGLKKEMKGYNACFFCMGISSVGKKEDVYTRITYDITLAAGNELSKLNSKMTFCYVSGESTDSSEKGRMMWARVKGKTENDLLKLFKAAYMFRPALIQPTKGMKNTYLFYKILAPLIPLLKLLFPKYICTLREVGLAMIHTVTKGYVKNILEVEDIKELAKESK
ncbi:MAG: epimerase [Leptospirales bacterium]